MPSMEGKPHPPELKAAVLASLLAGQGVGEVARQYKLAPSVVSRWKAKMPEEQAKHALSKEDADVYGDLLGRYLREILTTLAAQARFFRNAEWLEKQDARDLAVLHGVAADKAIRILEAAEAAGFDDDGNDLCP